MRIPSKKDECSIFEKSVNQFDSFVFFASKSNKIDNDQIYIYIYCFFLHFIEIKRRNSIFLEERWICDRREKCRSTSFAIFFISFLNLLKYLHYYYYYFSLFLFFIEIERRWSTFEEGGIVYRRYKCKFGLIRCSFFFLIQ